MTTIHLPELGEGIETATVACVHCKVGDLVKVDDELVEVVTDKASFNVPADCEGTVKEILIKEGDQPQIGAELIRVDA